MSYVSRADDNVTFATVATQHVLDVNCVTPHYKDLWLLTIMTMFYKFRLSTRLETEDKR